jgi:multimeric flavodoxin WrbA
MNIVVFNGSPRRNADVSFSRVYVDYVKSRYPSHAFTEFHIAREIRALKKKEREYGELIDAVRTSDGILWQMPVYSALVPAQVKEFLELVFADPEAMAAFKGKYAAMITTSIQFLDNWANNYIQAICEDLDVRFTGTFTGTFHPIVNDEYRRSLGEFLDRLFLAIEHESHPPRQFSPVKGDIAVFSPRPAAAREKTSQYRVTVIADLPQGTSNLAGMLDVVSGALSAEPDVVNLADTDYPGCHSCIQCAHSFTCCRADGFQAMHDDKVRTADALIFAGEIRDRYLSARIKTFLDREFYLNHIPFLKGKPVGVIVSGPLSQNALVRESLQSMLEARGAYIAGIVSDDIGSSSEIQQSLEWLAEAIERQIETAATVPRGFYGNAGARIFRDFVYLAKFPFVADHRHFADLNLYGTFPQKRLKVRFLTHLLQLKARWTGFPKTLEGYQQDRAANFRKMLIGE